MAKSIGNEHICAQSDIVNGWINSPQNHQMKITIKNKKISSPVSITKHHSRNKTNLGQSIEQSNWKTFDFAAKSKDKSHRRFSKSNCFSTMHIDTE